MTDLAAKCEVTLEGARREGWPRVRWHGAYICGEPAWRTAVAMSIPAVLDALRAACAAHARAQAVERAAREAGWPTIHWRGRQLAGELGWCAGLEQALADGVGWEEFEALRKRLLYGNVAPPSVAGRAVRRP